LVILESNDCRMSSFTGTHTDRDFDSRIISQILAGEKKLFELLMRRHNRGLFRIGMAIMSNDTDVEDIMQTAYIHAYEHLADFNHRSAFGTWLKRIFINECLLQLKRRKRTVNLDFIQLAEAKGSPMDRIINKELGNALEHALLEVPEKYRIVFVLREMENMSITETSEILNLTETNTKVRLNRAKTMLRQQINQYYKGYHGEAVFPFHLSRCDRIVGLVFQRLGIT
jgi:RNA polymerase sigma factor (sigma-70 family)